MKKYISLTALLIAGTVFVNADEVQLITSGPTSFTADLKGGTTNITLGGWDKDLNQILDISGSDVVTHLGAQSGWVLGAGTKNDSLPEKNTFGGTASYSSDTGAGFSITGRPAYRGEYAALVLEVGDLFVDVTNPTAITDISLSFNATGATAGSFTVWSIVGESASQLGNTVALKTDGDKSLSVSDLNLTDGKIALLFNTQNQGGGTNISISNLKGTAMVIPEPSTFGLIAGLGALALVGTRRRRK